MWGNAPLSVGESPHFCGEIALYMISSYIVMAPVNYTNFIKRNKLQFMSSLFLLRVKHGRSANGAIHQSRVWGAGDPLFVGE